VIQKTVIILCGLVATKERRLVLRLALAIATQQVVAVATPLEFLLPHDSVPLQCMLLCVCLPVYRSLMSQIKELY